MADTILTAPIHTVLAQATVALMRTEMGLGTAALLSPAADVNTALGAADKAALNTAVTGGQALIPASVASAGAVSGTTGAFTGVVTVSAGSAAAPAIISTTGTADTGIWFPAADTMAGSTSGVERWRTTSAGNFGIGNAGSLAPLQVGDRVVNNSSDAVILASRAVNDSVAGNGHCFSDSSLVTRTGDISYNSYDARINLTGSANYGHYAAFQSGPTFAGSGTITDVYEFVSGISISSGTITNRKGVSMLNPTVSGTGVVTNNYAIYVGAQTAGTSTNYAFYHAGTARFFSQGAIIGASIVSSANAVATATKQIEVQSADGTEAAFRLAQAGQNNWDLASVAGSTSFGITDAGGRVLTLKNGGNVGINNSDPLAKLDVNGDSIILRTAKTPASAAATGTVGMICWDASYIYICVATDTWKRSAIGTW